MNKLTDAELKRMRERYDSGDRRGMIRKSDKVPIHTIEIMWHEGTTKPGSNLEGKRYSDWYDYQNALKRINDDNKGDRPKGTYTKTKARFTWADGTQREARIDLGPNDYTPPSGKNHEYIGDYYKKTLRDGKRGEDGRWRAFSPPKYIKTRTGRDFGTGFKNDRKLDDDGYFRRPGGKSVKQTAPPEINYDACKCGECYTNKCKAYKAWNLKYVKGKQSQKKQPEEVFGSYSSKGYRPQKSKPYTSKKGPGKGWHGQISRHRMAAMKGRR
jgi:hypothetical protein